MFGPLVLFAARDPADGSGPLSVGRDALLRAERTGLKEWRVNGSASHRFVPFTEVGDQTYSTYVTAI